MHFSAIYRPKFTAIYRTKQTVKETESLWKNGCRQKCLDKSLDGVYPHYLKIYQNPPNKTKYLSPTGCKLLGLFSFIFTRDSFSYTL